MARTRDATVSAAERFELMHQLVDSPKFDLPIENWQELYELTTEFRPDLILELGRGWGNSTCVFTEAANRLGCRCVSVGFDSEHAWKTRTAPRLRRIVGRSWFSPLTVLQDDITTLDFGPFLGGSASTFVYWDAHGSAVADAVFDRIFPALPPENKVVVDDIWSTPELYGIRAEFQAGPLWSQFEELLPLWDYITRRHIDFEASKRWISFTARA
jgi:predicted O-methyltransferase YrrM